MRRPFTLQRYSVICIAVAVSFGLLRIADSEDKKVKIDVSYGHAGGASGDTAEVSIAGQTYTVSFGNPDETETIEVSLGQSLTLKVEITEAEEESDLCAHASVSLSKDAGCGISAQDLPYVIVAAYEERTAEKSFTIDDRPPSSPSNSPGEPSQTGGPDSCQACGNGGGGGAGPALPEPGSPPVVRPIVVSSQFGTGRRPDGLEALPRIDAKMNLATQPNPSRQQVSYSSLPEDQVVTDGGGLRQVLGQQTFVDMSTVSGATHLKFYEASSIAVPPQNNVPVSLPSSPPIAEYRISSATHPNFGNGIKQLTVDVQGAVTGAYELYSQQSGNGVIWREKTTSGRVIEGVEALTVTNYDPLVGQLDWTRTVSKIEKEENSTGQEVLIGETIEVFEPTPAGERVTRREETVAVGSPAKLVTLYTYDSEGEIETIIHPDGSWERRERYVDGFGNDVETTYTPWLDGPATPDLASHSNCRKEVVIFDGPYLESKFEYVLGVLVKKDRHNWNYDGGFFAPDGSVRALGSIRTDTDAGSNGYITSLRSQITDDADGLHLGRAFYRIPFGDSDPDGSADFVWEDRGFFDSATRQFTVDPVGTAIRSRATATSLAGFSGTTGATRVFTISDRLGVLQRESQVYVNDAFQTISTEDFLYDSKDRLSSVTRNGTTVESYVYEDLGTFERVTVTDASGFTTVRESDADSGELIASARVENGVEVSRTVYSGDGLVSTTVLTFVDSTTRTTTETRNLAGRIISETDADGVTTTYNDPSPLVSEVVSSLGTTRRTERYLDGRIKSERISGSGGAILTETFHTYELLPSGDFLNTIYQGADATSPRWTATLENELGQVLETRTPAPNGGIAVTTHTYDGSQLVSTVPPSPLGEIAYEYDDLGNRSATTVDLNGNGADPADAEDLRTTSVREYIAEAGTFWSRQTDSVITPDLPGGVLTRISMSEVGTAAGGKNKTIDPHGNITQSSATVDRATATTVTVSSSSVVPNPTTVTAVYGRVLTSVLPDGSSITYGYDARGNRTSAITSFGATEGYTYNTKDQLDTSTDPLGRTSIYTYDPSGNLATVTNPKQETITYHHDLLGRRIGESGATYAVRHSYNPYGERVAMTTFPVGSQTGDPTTWTGGNTTQWQFDPASGVLLARIEADGTSTGYTYHPSGQTATRSRARSVPGGALLTTSYTYDGAGRPLTVTHNDGTAGVVYDYYPDGRLESVTDGVGTHTYGYTATGAPDTESIQSSFLSDHVLTRAPGPFGLDTGYDISVNGQMAATKRIVRATTSTGRDESVSGFHASAHYGYNPGRPGVASTTFRSTRPGTAGGDLLVSETVRDLAGQIDQIITGGTTTFDYVYDTAGRRDLVTLADGRQWDYGYNAKGEVTSGSLLEPGGSAVPGLSFTYGYDGIGNRAYESIGTPGNNGIYQHNNVNQLSSATLPSFYHLYAKVPADRAATSTISVDGQTMTSLGGGLFHRSIGRSGTSAVKSLNYLRTDGDITVSETATLALLPKNYGPTYDLDGNLTSDGLWLYTWNAENQLVAIESDPRVPLANHVAKRYRYDYRGRRVEEITLRALNGQPRALVERRSWIYDGWNPVVECENGVPRRAYLWGTDLSGTEQGAGGVGGVLAMERIGASGETAWLYSFDGNGNVAEVFGDGGQSLATYLYDPFGNVVWEEGSVAKENRWRFSTKLEDVDTGLCYYGYRYYDSGTGRWVSRDPIEEDGGVNLYGFVGNDGVAGTDVLGLCDFFSEKGLLRWVIGDGSPLQLEWGCFDNHPKRNQKEDLNKLIIKKLKRKLDKRCRTLKVGTQKHLTISSNAGKSGVSTIHWINDYQSNVYINNNSGPGVIMQKYVKENGGCECYIAVDVTYKAEDDSDFNLGDSFTYGPLTIKDKRLIELQNLGVGTDYQVWAFDFGTIDWKFDVSE